MLKRLVPALCLSLSLLPAMAQVAPDAAPPAPMPAAVLDNPPEQVLVIGQRPGPGLWKVSKDEHVLWVFGLYSPLPKQMEWRSAQVEQVLLQSQEFIGQPGAQAKVSFLRGLTLLPFAIGLKKNPDGAQLRDVLPPEVYARWQPLKDKYFGDDDSIERNRPYFVAEELFRRGLEQAGLTRNGEVLARINKLVKERNIKSTLPAIELEVDSPVKAIRKFKKTPMDDVACFTRTIERLETDVDAMRLRANAWAMGDVEGMLKLRYVDHEGACDAALLDIAFMREQPGGKPLERIHAAWLAAAEKALAANASTFAVLPMKAVLDPQAYLAALAAKGYKVERPD